MKRGYKGGRKSSDITSKPVTDDYRKGWQATFGKNNTKQKGSNG